MAKTQTTKTKIKKTPSKRTLTTKAAAKSDITMVNTSSTKRTKKPITRKTKKELLEELKKLNEDVKNKDVRIDRLTKQNKLKKEFADELRQFKNIHTKHVMGDGKESGYSKYTIFGIILIVYLIALGILVKTSFTLNTTVGWYVLGGGLLVLAIFILMFFK